MADNSKVNNIKAWDKRSLNHLIELTIKRNWELMAFSDLGGISFKFSEVAERVEKLHILFSTAGIKPGDKVAICGKNSSMWAVVFIACLTYGAVAVPILHEFKPENIHTLVNHSESKLLFVDASIWKQLDAEKLPELVGAFFLSENGLPLSRSKKLSSANDEINELFGEKYPKSFTPADINYYHDTPEEICVINYTSGSTGASKGVMLPYRSLWSNIDYCINHLHFLQPGDGIVNMLPLGHLYGMVIEMLHPFVKGCHCNFITKAPSPRILLAAFEEVRPKLIITVPLVLEKIIRNNVFPKIHTPMMNFLMKLPIINKRIYAKIREQLINVFGGQLEELIIGGAPLNGEVESFLYKIKFPITVGYGMTECGPLLTYAPPQKSKPHTVGEIVDRMQVRIDSPDPANIPGNIWVRGDNVMKGYFKNEEATRDVMPHNDGWMNTGDMGTIDSDGIIAIKGRSKTMILGPSGQNIYPEEIEQVINNMPYVNESLVIEDNGKLIALIHPDLEAAEKDGINKEELEKVMDDNLKKVNGKLESYNRLSRYKIMEAEFEKTPKRSIKRYLYSNL